MAPLSVRVTAPPLRVARSLALHDPTLPLESIHEAALVALPEEARFTAAVDVLIKRGADLSVGELSLPRSGASDDARLCACAERAMEAAFAAAAAAKTGASARAEERRAAAAAWRKDASAWRAAYATSRRVAREAAEAEEEYAAPGPAHRGQAPGARQGKNRPPRRRAAAGVEGRDMRRCVRPGVDGRVLRRHGRAGACARRRSRLDKGLC